MARAADHGPRKLLRVGFTQSFEAWNRAIELRSPRVGEVVTLTGWADAQRVFDHSSFLWMVGPNLLARLDHGWRGTGDPAGAPVRQLYLILTASYFAPTAHVRTEDLPPFAMLARTLPCSAAELHAHLAAPRERELIILTGPREILIVHQGTTEFAFGPVGTATVQSMEQTVLRSVDFLYSDTARGTPPGIEEPGC